MTDSISQIQQSLLNELELACCLVSKNEEAEWDIEWQNPAAQVVWGHYDLNKDFELRLALLAAFQHTVVTSFFHRIDSVIEPLRFIVTPFHQKLLLQFFIDEQSPQVESEALKDVYALALETSQIGVFDINLASKKVTYTNKIFDILTIPPALLGNTQEYFFKQIHPDDLQQVQDAYDAHLETRWPFSVEFRMQTGQGNFLWVQSRGQAVYDEDELPVRFVGSLSNISDRKYAEEMAVEKELLVEQIIDSLPISIYVKDEKGCFRFFSRQTEKETGVDRRSAIGRTDYEIFPINLARQQIMQDQVAKEEGRIIISEEKFDVGGAVKPRWLLLGKGPIKVKAGSDYENWILGFSLDITDRKAMEEMLKLAKEEAENAAKAKSEFLSVMSHEIRTPLNSVIGTAQLILDSDLNEEQKNHADMIYRSGEHLLYLINDILDFSKLEAEKVQVEHRLFNLRQQVETVVNISDVDAKLKGVKVSLTIEEEVASHYLGDEARIRQILLNLMSNAVKFTEKGFVALRVSSSEPDQLRFEVQDTGIGISSSEMNKLFVEFSQADVSTTRKYGGTGLGLSICKKLTELMGGNIGVNSEQGKGSVFWFELPLEKAEEQVLTELNITEHQDQEMRILKILVAEDNPSNQLLIKAILTKMGHDVTMVNNGLKAYHKVQELKYDLVLMDMQMPEMDGLTSTGLIRGLDSDVSQIPIIALTANALSGDRERVLKAGMNDYLTKPIDFEALKHALGVWGSHSWSTLT